MEVLSTEEKRLLVAFVCGPYLGICTEVRGVLDGKLLVHDPAHHDHGVVRLGGAEGLAPGQ